MQPITSLPSCNSSIVFRPLSRRSWLCKSMDSIDLLAESPPSSSPRLPRENTPRRSTPTPRFRSAKQSRECSVLSTPPEFVFTEMHYDTSLQIETRVDGIAYVSQETFQWAFQTKLNVEVIDCRFPYEFENGHIKGAVNIWDESSLLQHFFTQRPPMISNKIVVFYCEFSKSRGPCLAKKLRNLDIQNSSKSQTILFPDIYVISGGFKVTYAQAPWLCVGVYVPMDDIQYQQEKIKYSKCLTKNKTFQYSKPRLFSSFTYNY
ncbi:protein-tyrosine-phosphatase [Entamoeba marina]